MNDIILNGKKSTLIKGLLIQSLPFISKPLIRTEVEEIDGRDGDIVTKLGYSAYDKTFSVGLYGDFDINEVIEYFDSEGQVIFSNEPDKYYNYQIIDQIDFERLVRYRTAEVTMHCQPFKYSAIDKPVGINNMISVSDQTMTKNGVTLAVDDNTISVTGTASTATEFYLPINKAILEAGSYVLRAITAGSGCNACSIRLIDGVPSNAKSFGGTYLGLTNNNTRILNGTLTAKQSYDYLWFYITSGTAMNFTLDTILMGYQMSLTNLGNIFAKPSVTIYGTGVINLSLNGEQIFVINMTTDSITIDAEEMQAFMGELLLNRNVIGNYDDLALIKGTNTISWTGDVSQILVDKYSRWI